MEAMAENYLVDEHEGDSPLGQTPKGYEFGDDPRIDLASLRIDLSNPEPDPHSLITVDGITVFSPGNIGVVKAGSKQGKTWVISAMIAAFILSGQVIKFVGNPLPNKRKVVLIDTEQAKSHVHKVARRIHRMAGLPTNQNSYLLEIYYFKELTTQQRLDALRKIAQDPEIGMIVVDGIIDLIFDFNDIAESTMFRDELMQLVSLNEIVLISVIHTNKRDANSRGHIGAMLEQKSETTIQLTKENEIFTVDGVYTRNPPFDEFSFVISSDALPELIDRKEDKKLVDANKRRANFAFVLSGQKLLSYNDLVREYCEFTGLKERSTANHIKEARTSNWILKHESGMYSLVNFNTVSYGE